MPRKQPQPKLELDDHTQAPVQRDERYQLECQGIPTRHPHEVVDFGDPSLENPNATNQDNAS